jgi:hypothetical protein
MADLSDRTDNVSIGNDANTKIVTVTTDGAKERLDVDATISGSVKVSELIPKWRYSTTTVALTNGVDTTIETITANGRIDFVQVIAKNSSFEIILIFDGVERLRITQDQLGVIGLLSSNSTGIPIYAASASKIFSLHPNTPFDFTTDFTIKIKATAAGNDLQGYMIDYREHV